LDAEEKLLLEGRQKFHFGAESGVYANRVSGRHRKEGKRKTGVGVEIQPDGGVEKR